MLRGDEVWRDALGQAAAIRSGSASASELLEAYLERIERLDGTLNAYVTVDSAGARAAARRADEAVAAGPAGALPPFHGVAISVKDNTDVAGLPTTYSCKLLAENTPARDAAVVRRFREAGFIVLGKTNVPEFDSSMTDSELNGLCRNPWDLERTPGGSSGGAAAALAAGLCAVAHGTDGAGSVRVPASFCGLVGLKPTRGTGFSFEDGNPFFGTSVDGTLSRSVRDAAALMDVLSAPGPATPGGAGSFATAAGEPPGRLRIALTTQAPMGETQAECAAAARAVAERLAALGHDVEERTPSWKTILAAANVPLTVPGPARLLREDQFPQVEPRNRALVAAMASLRIVDHAAAVDRVRAAAREFETFWEDVDVLVSPTAGIVPPSVDYAPWHQSPEEHAITFAAFPNFAQPFNLSGQPALSLPLGRSGAGLPEPLPDSLPDPLPIGVQLAGRRGEERVLLRLAAQLERELPWVERRPAAFAAGPEITPASS